MIYIKRLQLISALTWHCMAWLAGGQWLQPWLEDIHI